MIEPSGGRERRIALALLGLGIVVVFAEGFVGRVPTMRDVVGFTLPSRAVWRDTLLGGDLSAYNPLAGLGLSRLAAPVHGVLYPGHLPLLVGSIETGFVVTWVAHVIWAGLGGYALGRALGMRPCSAVLPGALWAIGGYAVSMWWNGEKVLTCAWLPWFAWSVELAARPGKAWFSRATWGVLGSTAMIAYAGDPFLLFDAVGLALAVRLATDPEPAGERIRAAVRPALGIALGVALAAPTLIPAWAMRGDTVRAEALTSQAAETWSMHPARIAELFLPGWFGDPFDVEHYPGGAFADDPTSQALPWAVSMYAGAAVLLFAPLARGRRRVTALGGVALVFLLLAFGRFTPLNDLARTIVPGLSLFRYPEKHAIVVVGLLGLLAGFGLERVLTERLAAWRRAAWPLGAVALAALFAPSPLRAAAHAGALHAAVATVLIAGAAELALRKPDLGWVVALVAVLDLAVAARPFLRWAPRPVFESAFARPLAQRSQRTPARVYRPRAGDFETGATLPDSAAQVLGFAALPGHDPAHSVRLDVLLKAFEREPSSFAALFALDALLLPDTVRMPSPPEVSDRGWSLYLLAPAPRAWVVGAVRTEDAKNALRRLVDPSFDPYSEAIVTARDDALLGDLPSQPRARAGDCSVATYRRARIELDCEAKTSGFAVISELDTDGWRAFVDGREVPVYTTDLVLRGVVVGAGRHRVEMRYETPGLFEGSAIAAVAMALALLGSSRALWERWEARLPRARRVQVP
jgi:hypothetical protein